MSDLVSAVVDVREKLGRALFTNEAQVSNGVVMRLLRDLGWDVHDPEQVMAEFSIGNRRVDYALVVERFIMILIEVKRVGKLSCKAVRQLFEYCFTQGVPLAVLTDGREWDFFIPAGAGSFEERRFARMDLAEEEPSSCAVKLARYLGRGAVVSGQARRDAQDDYDAHLQQLEAGTAQPAAVRGDVRTGDPKTGECSFVLLGTARSFPSNRKMMLALLEELANRDPAFCAKYAQVRTDIKRQREDFSESGRRSAHVLPGGWWVRHGGSVTAQRRRVSAAAEAAGIAYGRDLLNLRGEGPDAGG